jgi:N-methylhydantoinase A
MSDVKHDYVRSRLSKLASIDEATVDAQFADLVVHAREELLSEGFAQSAIEIERSLDMRYAGQGYELTMPLPETLGEGGLRKLRADFDEAHRQQFGHTAPNEPVEIVSYRLRGVGRVAPVKLPSFTPQGLNTADAIREHRDMRFDGKTLSCPVYQREKLDVGATFDGPAVVDQLDCTTVVFPGQHARVDAYKNIIITMGDA